MQKPLLATATVAVTATVAMLQLSLTNNAEAANMKEVNFESNNQNLVGNLYLPDDYQEGDKLPGVVVTGAWTTVKEQMPATYAEELADRGYAVLAFDFRNWGKSGGNERQLENPANKTQDIIAAAHYLTTRPEVDTNRIGGLGICASAGYMADAAVQSDDIQAIALVAPWLHNQKIVNEIYGGEESVRSLIDLSQKAQARYETTGELSLAPAASTTDKDAIMYQVPYYTETDRGAIPEYVNQFNLASWEGWLTYDAITIADRLTKPVMIVHSQEAAIPQGAQQFYSRLSGDKQQLWLEEVTQFDFYDSPNAVTQASDAVAEYFEQTI
ncbi:alpha/beta hydrolase [Roseofilum reptotaenium CS-1145]|nr:alpha/beta hydrolase [Roseofilum reptotaenium]MDB9517039.1 alpha/beta hydrolase [Roseofilum reptotaenium CS-1145]